MAFCDRRVHVGMVLLFMIAGCTPDESDTLTPDQVFIKYYGGSGIEVAADFVSNTDANLGLSYVIFGSSNSPEMIDEARSAAENRDFVLLFANKEGNLADDEKRFYYPAELTSVTNNVPKRLKKTSDGGYIMVGTAIYDGQSDMYVVKTDASGLEERHWYNRSTEVETANDILEISDGFIAVGSVGTGANRKFTITKLVIDPVPSDADEFRVLWNYESESSGNAEEAVSIHSIDGGNGALVLVNTRQNISLSAPQNGNLLFVSLPTTVLQEPNPTLFGPYGDDDFDEVAVSMRKISDSDIYIVGNSTTTGNTDQTPFFMRATGVQFSSRSNVRFDELDRYDMTAASISRTANGNYLMLATGVSDLTNGAQLMLLRLDAFGALDESFGGTVTPFIQYGERGNETGVSVAQLPDGGIGILGTMGFDNNANTVMGLIKTNGDGVLGK